MLVGFSSPGIKVESPLKHLNSWPRSVVDHSSHSENSIYRGRGITGLFRLPSVTPRRCGLSDAFHEFSFCIQLIDVDAQSNLCHGNNGNF